MVYTEIIALCSEVVKRRIPALYAKNLKFLNVKSGGTYSNH